LTRLRLGVVLALAVAFGALCHAPKAMAAPEIHRANLVISAMPAQLDGGGMNDLLTRYNQYPLADRGLEPIDKIKMGWTFDAELRYFVRPNFALAAGVGQLKVETRKEFLPSIPSDINLRAEVITVPIHVGAQYYLAPYTQGDFQARAYIGAGLLSLTASRAEFSVFETGLDARPANPAIPGSTDTLQANSLGGRNLVRATGDGSGFYFEAGAHLFFAARYSLIVGAIYREMKLTNLTNVGKNIIVPQPDPIPEQSGLTLPMVLNDNSGNPLKFGKLDLSGVGVRAAVAIGF
jgi:hypothetical protein